MAAAAKRAATQVRPSLSPPRGGSFYLDDDDERPDPGKPVHTFVTARMLHAYSLGHLDGAVQLFHRAVADGWAVDGDDGLVYTTG